jgi:hypothetical protein
VAGGAEGRVRRRAHHNGGRRAVCPVRAGVDERPKHP